jgi:hypothetical protein
MGLVIVKLIDQVEKVDALLLDVLNNQLNMYFHLEMDVMTDDFFLL